MVHILDIDITDFLVDIHVDSKCIGQVFMQNGTSMLQEYFTK